MQSGAVAETDDVVGDAIFCFRLVGTVLCNTRNGSRVVCMNQTTTDDYVEPFPAFRPPMTRTNYNLGLLTFAIGVLPARM
jgi:hypothetical protein